MQRISNEYEVTLKFNVFILLWIFLLMPELSFGEMSHESGMYFEAVGGYNQNMAKNTSKIYDAENKPMFRYQTKKNLFRPNIHIGTGYQWQVDDDWSWSTGWRLNYNLFVVRGSGELLNAVTKPFKYQFTISSLSAEIINRLIYTEEHWEYYGAFSAGFGKLKSYKYQRFLNTFQHKSSNARGGYEGYKDKTVNNLLYSISLGILRRLSESISLGIDMGISDMKAARLGKHIAEGATGFLKQELRVMNINVSFIYQF